MFYGIIFSPLTEYVFRCIHMRSTGCYMRTKTKRSVNGFLWDLLHHAWAWKLKALINSERYMSFIIFIVIVIGRRMRVRVNGKQRRQLKYHQNLLLLLLVLSLLNCCIYYTKAANQLPMVYYATIAYICLSIPLGTYNKLWDHKLY